MATAPAFLAHSFSRKLFPILLHLGLPSLAVFAAYFPKPRAILVGSAVVLIILWDFWFYRNKQDGVFVRTVGDLTRALQEIRSTLSWFILLFGVTLAFLIARSEMPDAIKRLQDACVGTTLLFAPLITAVIGVIFIPMRLSTEPGESGSPTPAFAVHFVIAAIMQKVSVVLMLTLLLSIAIGFSRFDPNNPSQGGCADDEPAGEIDTSSPENEAAYPHVKEDE